VQIPAQCLSSAVSSTCNPLNLDFIFTVEDPAFGIVLAIAYNAY